MPAATAGGGAVIGGPATRHSSVAAAALWFCVASLVSASAVGAPGDFRQCLPAGAGASSEMVELAAARDMLVGSPAFGSYFAGILDSTAVSVCFDPAAVDCRGYMEPEANVIALAPRLSCGEKALILAHELRHLWQYRRGFSMSLDHDVREHVRLTYAIEADAQAFATYVAFVERDREPSLWQAARRLSNYEDIAAAIEQAASAGATPADIMLAGFTAWYASSWRLRQYYRGAAGNYLDRLDELSAVRHYGRFPAGRFDDLCQMPDGSNYGCQATAEIMRPPEPP